MRLKDKVILITGSTTGIGESMARRFAQEGAQVIVHGRREDAARKLTREIGERASYITGALEDERVPAQMIEETIHRHGRLDALVNNAAVITRSNLESTDAKVFDHTLAVNLKAPFLLIKAALPYFLKQGGGRVLNIGSVNAYCGEPHLFAYSISKGGLMTLTRNLADAHGHQGIRVNQLNVGWTLTPNEYELQKREGLSDDWPSKVSKTFAPSGRLLSPDEIASAATYFLSDEASLINGAVVELEQYPVIGRNPAKQESPK